MSGWIAADWGTSRLRVWALSGDGEVTQSLSSGDGMGRLSPAEFSLRILPGLCQSDPPDVMRGEETQIAGFLAADPGFDGVICLPGTHTKWVRVSEGRVTAFRTAMTGEMFELMATRSTLAGFAGEGWDDAAFDSGLAQGAGVGMTDAPALAADLFGIRAAALLSPPVPGVARARLSGLLIGAEVAGMRGFWRDRQVALIGDPALTALYRQALATAGGEARLFGAEALTLNGLRAAQRRYPEDQP